MPGKRCIPSQRQITLAQRTVGSPQAPHGRFQRFDFFGGFFEPLQVAQKQALIGTKPRPSRYEVMVKSAFTSSSLLADFLRKGRMRGLTRYSKRAEARQLRGPHLSLELASAFTASFRSSARLCEHLRAVSRRGPQPSALASAFLLEDSPHLGEEKKPSVGSSDSSSSELTPRVASRPRCASSDLAQKEIDHIWPALVKRRGRLPLLHSLSWGAA